LHAARRHLSLDDVDVTYSQQPARSKRVGGLNALGFAAWLNVEGAVVCFTLKSLIVFGAIRLHALRVRGLTNARYRTELAGTPNKPEGTARYAVRLVDLLVRGVGLGRVGDRVKLLKDVEPTVGRARQEAAFFGLVAATSRK
jgi:hypothetical protein